MKNKLLIFILFYSLLSNISFAEQFIFETSQIEIVDNGNIVNATDGKAISSDKNLEIKAKKFEYKKNLNLLKAFNGTAYFKSDDLEIKFGEINLDQNTFITTAKDNVKILDLKKNILIESNLIIFEKKKGVLRSSVLSKLKDEMNNKISSENFNFNLNDGILKLQNVKLEDFNDNFFEIDAAYLNTETNELVGKDISINLNNKSFNEDNEPRLKGKSISYANGLTEITKGVFTTCKKRDKCPPWQLSAEKIQHDSRKKTISYKNAILRVYDLPVMYFPKFFHPDPTVERQSGFLIPTIKNSSNSNSSFLKVPYFAALSQNKDMTFSPRLYSNNDFLLQTEFRQKNKNSDHISDISFFNQKDENSKTHFFYKYNKLIELTSFDDAVIDLKIEKTSNDTYLRKNKLSSPIIKSLNVLENKIGLYLSSNDFKIDSEIKIYEDLDKENNDRFEFLPKVEIEKKIKNFTQLDGNFLLKSENFIRSYATNILEKVNINDLIFNSNPKTTNAGLYNNYEFMIKNINSDTQNSDNYEEDENFYLSGLFQFNSSFPLVKESNNSLKILKPKLSLKVSPNHTKDLSTTDGKRLDVDNIYNFNRLSANNAIEGGLSIALGNDFSIYNKEKSREVFGFKLANNFRLEENKDLPKNNQLGSKNSNFFGEISYNPSEIFSAKYNASARNNLTDINYENFSAEISLNNFITTFDYLNENNSTDKNSYLTNTTIYKLNENNNIKFSTRENKSSNLTEYYNLIYEYKNDCLAASFEYNKDYYDDRDIKPEENIFLKLTIIPFGETSSPNLKD